VKAEAECQIRPDPSGPVSTRKFLEIARGRPAMSRIPLHGLQRGKDTELDLEKLRLLDDGDFIPTKGGETDSRPVKRTEKRRQPRCARREDTIRHVQRGQGVGGRDPHEVDDKAPTLGPQERPRGGLQLLRNKSRVRSTRAVRKSAAGAKSTQSAQDPPGRRAGIGRTTTTLQPAMAMEKQAEWRLEHGPSTLQLLHSGADRAANFFSPPI